MNRTRSVLIAHPGAELYGSDRVLLDTVTVLVERGWTVTVTVPEEGPLVDAVRATGAMVLQCPTPVLRRSALRPDGLLAFLATVLRSVGPARRLVRATRPDVIVVSTVTIPLWGLLGRLLGIGVLVHVHEAEAAISRWLRRVLLLPLLAATSIVVNSEFTLAVLADGWARLVPRARIVTNLVRGPQVVQESRTELTDSVRLLYVGRLSPRKGPQLIVEALDQLRVEGIDASLELVGSVFPGYEWFEEELHEQVRRLDLDSRVRFVGFRTDVWPSRAACDVAVVPSIGDESFGNVAVESLLAARPAVVSTSGGLAEAVRGYRSALLVPPDDAAAITTAVSAIVEDWPRYRELAAADARTAADRQSATRYGEHIERALLDTMVTARPAEIRPSPTRGLSVTTTSTARPERPSIVLAMLTYKRPEDLHVAVPALLEQIEQTDYDTTVLIVDNDPAGTAMPTAADFPSELVRFVHEPTPGIAAARNRALREVTEADLLVFIDDDERPEPDWLRLLVETWRSTGATAVVGPVISTYSAEPEAWITEGGFFDRRRLPTGTEIDVAATNNLLLDMARIRDFGLEFDLAFGITGGSDTVFTREIVRHGGRMVWCDEAIVVDVVPLSRMTRQWVLQRALRTGNGWSRTSLALLDGRPLTRTRERLALTAQGLVRIAGGGSRLLLGTVTGSLRLRARGMRTLARGFGITTGAWGYHYSEYRRKRSAT